MTNANGMHLALPEWQRVRLRPDVDVPSLERFLEELPASARPTVLRHFEPDVLPRTDQREDRSSMSGTQAEERVGLQAEEADYVHIAYTITLPGVFSRLLRSAPSRSKASTPCGAPNGVRTS